MIYYCPAGFSFDWDNPSLAFSCSSLLEEGYSVLSYSFMGLTAKSCLEFREDFGLGLLSDAGTVKTQCILHYEMEMSLL
jgi:hypothetical protein